MMLVRSNRRVTLVGGAVAQAVAHPNPLDDEDAVLNLDLALDV
jgi:hypothetical protein